MGGFGVGGVIIFGRRIYIVFSAISMVIFIGDIVGFLGFLYSLRFSYCRGSKNGYELREFRETWIILERIG